MTVRIGDVTFFDWISLQYTDGWTDTFIFCIDSKACIPPFNYAPLIRRLVAHVVNKRSCASIWVQVDSPGEWFMLEVRKSLRGLKLPFVVTRKGDTPRFEDFSFRPTLHHDPLRPPPNMDDGLQSYSSDELRCLRALGRMAKGNEHEVEVMTDLPMKVARDLLVKLESEDLVEQTNIHKTKHKKSKPTQPDLFPIWRLRPKGLSMALRSWGAPKGVQFTSRKEAHLQQIGYDHRYISRIWKEWLRTAWPDTEIWTGWSEVRIPESRVVPDGLAWGRAQGYETLFWLEAGDTHKSENRILKITRKRLVHARILCQRTGVRLVYAQLSTNWVHDAVRWACVDLTVEEAVVLGNLRRFGELPMLEWGTISRFIS